MTPEIDKALTQFLSGTSFCSTGGIMTDLDGTAVHEFEGRIVIPERIAIALKTLNERGRPAIINSLRFPLNVINTFGREWYSITSAPLPMVSLNGAQVGYLVETADGQISFREADSFPLLPSEIAEAVGEVDALLKGGADELALFLYPRDWTKGEMIWTRKRHASTFSRPNTEVPAWCFRQRLLHSSSASMPNLIACCSC